MAELPLPRLLAPTGERIDGAALLAALQALPPERLPLQALCTLGGVIDGRQLVFSLLGVDDRPDASLARVSVFFTEILGGCNCHDDPVATPGHGVLELRIDRGTGSARVRAVAADY